MAGGDHVAQITDSGIRRERPWLLPYNRKLRHLQGITIRNLTLAQTPPRPRRTTIDDEALPSALQTPAKALAQRETRKLEHTRSSTELRTINESARNESESAIADGAATQPTSARPVLARLRRRSTMEWASASPLTRQKKLEDVTGGRMADTFFSLHVTEIEEPIYVSEVAEKAMNPNFRFFDLESWGPSVTRLDGLTVKVWTKSGNMQEYQCLVELTLSLRSLQFISKALENFHHPLPQNCVLFHLSDGVYTSFTDMPTENTTSTLPSARALAQAPTGRALSTSSYDALMRLSTLDDCIQDALATREKLAAQISAILDTNQQSTSLIRQVPERGEYLKLVESAVNTQRKRLEASGKKRDGLKASIATRREAIRKGRETQARAQEDIAGAAEKLKRCRETIQQTTDEIHGQRRRICEDVLRIYPIEPILGRSLAFTIRELPLPNSEFDDAKEEVVSAALGYVAHVVYLLSFYLSVPLPYPVQPRSSTSVINDPISMTAGSRTYPLFLKGSIRYRFEYGVFLLNKDIEMLSNWLGLKILDIRQTLPNLKYLLYIATAGKGELPARKAGGIRGLLKGRATPSMSRRESQESNASSTAQAGGTAVGGCGMAANAASGQNGCLAKQSEKAKATVGPLSQSAPHHASPLRDTS